MSNMTNVGTLISLDHRYYNHSYRQANRYKIAIPSIVVAYQHHISNVLTEYKSGL